LGERLFLMEHTHPIPWCFSCNNYGSSRGPSWVDSTNYPSQDILIRSGTFFVIQDVAPNGQWGFIYYGRSAGK
jgi:hypothetical protein